MLQSTDPKRLSSKRGHNGEIISVLGKGNRRDLLGKLWIDRDRNMRNKIGEWVEGESNKSAVFVGNISGSSRNLVPRKLP